MTGTMRRNGIDPEVRGPGRIEGLPYRLNKKAKQGRPPERKRELKEYRLPDKSADSVIAAFQSIRDSLGKHFSDVFKTITTDNGSAFVRLSELEKGSHTKVYFAHPYSSWEKGSIPWSVIKKIRKYIHPKSCLEIGATQSSMLQ